MKTKVAFVGLGVMGFPMAGHLARAGYDMTVYNRTVAKARRWAKKFGGRVEKTPERAARGAAYVFSCVGADDDVRAVTTAANGAFHGIAKGAVYIDHTTASAGLARDLGKEAKRRGFQFLDAPVSGGQAGAENGALTVMVGGGKGAFRRAAPVIQSYAREVRLLGSAGAGQLTKMVNQICIAGAVQGLAEGLSFAQRAGLDGEEVLEVISKGAAQSWQMENRGKTMLRGEYEFGFSVDWMRKDLSLCLAEGRRNSAPLPIAALIDQFYADIQEMGGRRWDTSSLMARLTRD